MLILTMATTVNVSNKELSSSHDSDADTWSICEVEDDKGKCVNITNTGLAYDNDNDNK